MDKKISLKQAYNAMFIFIKEYYYRTGQPDDIGRLLGDIQLFEDGIPADPASWQDWIEAVNKVLKGQKGE